MKKVFYLLLILACGVCAWFLFLDKDVTTPVSFEIKKLEALNENDRYSINAEYPEFESGASAKVLGGITSELKDFATSNAKKAEDDFNDILADFPDQDGLTYLSKASVFADVLWAPFINVLFESYDFAGGAHGITTKETFVFDTRTGKRLGLADIFQDEYLKQLQTLSLEAIKDTDPNLDTYTFAVEGTSPEEKNFSTFTIQPDGFHVIFNDYQIGPYVVGSPEFIIPFDSLKDVIRPEVWKLVNKKEHGTKK